MQTNSTFLTIFFTRKPRGFSNELSIYARITVDGQRSEISLKRNVLVSHWDNNKARCRGNTTKVRFLNAYLDEVYNQILDCHKQLFQEGKMVSANGIKGRFLGEDDDRKTLRELIEYHNTNMITVLKFGTMKNYYTTEK